LIDFIMCFLHNLGDDDRDDAIGRLYSLLADFENLNEAPSESLDDALSASLEALDVEDAGSSNEEKH
jgi:hypothetical protein